MSTSGTGRRMAVMDFVHFWIWTTSVLLCGSHRDMAQGIPNCGPGAVYVESTSRCRGMLVVDSKALQDGRTVFNGKSINVTASNVAGIRNDTVGVRHQPSLLFVGAFQISLAAPQMGVNLSSSWTMVGTIDLPVATPFPGRAITLFTTSDGEFRYHDYTNTSDNGTSYFATLTIMQGNTTRNIRLTNNGEDVPQFGWSTLILVYSNVTRQLVVSVDDDVLASVTLTGACCVGFVKGLEARTAANRLNGLYRMQFVQDVLTQQEAGNLRGCAYPESSTLCHECGGLSNGSICLPVPQLSCPQDFVASDTYMCEAPGPCLVAGTIPTNRNAVLTGGRGSHRHSWVLPSVRVQNCSVTVRGFEIYHSSMTDCNLTVSLWRPQQNTTNRYNVLYNTSPATLSKDSSFVRHFFSQSDQYQISNSTTSVVFGLITHNTGCRILGNDITTDRAQFRTNTSNIDSIGRRRIFGKYQTIDVAFRVLFQDINECLLGIHNCSVDKLCVNTDSGYICQAKDLTVTTGTRTSSKQPTTLTSLTLSSIAPTVTDTETLTSSTSPASPLSLFTTNVTTLQLSIQSTSHSTMLATSAVTMDKSSTAAESLAGVPIIPISAGGGAGLIIFLVLVIVVLACRKKQRKEVQKGVTKKNSAYYDSDSCAVVLSSKDGILRSDSLVANPLYKSSTGQPTSSTFQPGSSEENTSSYDNATQRHRLDSLSTNPLYSSSEIPNCTDVYDQPNHGLDHQHHQIAPVLPNGHVKESRDDYEVTEQESTAIARASDGYEVVNTPTTQDGQHSPIYDRLIRHIDNDTPVNDPPYAVPALYDHLQSDTYRKLEELQVIIHEQLGEGNFGEVYRGTLHIEEQNLPVAVKTLKTRNEDGLRSLLQEASLMGQLHHPNIVRLCGISTSPDKVLVAVELMGKGDLRSHLKKLKAKCSAKTMPAQLLRYAQDAAAGMAYLESRKFIHRDLAARNIMVNARNTCKVGDFGMSRLLAEATYYASHGGMIPFRSTAPEGLLFRRYSTASDVWSYGILLYELYSFGATPYEGMDVDQLLKFVDTDKHRLSPPPGCSRPIYNIMIDCWHPHGASRPTFRDIKTVLRGKSSEILTLSPLAGEGSPSVFKHTLGADVCHGQQLYVDLQNTYTAT